jgi:hypothetical protein
MHKYHVTIKNVYAHMCKFLKNKSSCLVLQLPFHTLEKKQRDLTTFFIFSILYRAESKGSVSLEGGEGEREAGGRNDPNNVRTCK